MLSMDSIRKVDDLPASDPDVEHSPMGPSSGERWMNCSASVDFTKDMKDRNSIYAAEGTAAHELSEWMRNEGKPAKHYLGREIKAKGFTFEVTQEMATNVQQFVDYCDEFCDDDVFVEERVHYTAWVPNGWGTADDIRFKETVCKLTDLKYGKGVKVNAKNNTQLLLYALGVFQEYHHLYDIEEFILAIHQPRLNHVDEWTVTTKELLVWARDVVMPAAQEVLEGGKFFPGKWCQFCRGKNLCEARANANVDDFDDLDGTPVNAIPNYRLAELLDKVPEIKQWCADIEARALSEVQRGNPVGEYKLVAGRSYRKWKDSAEAEKALRGVRKLKVADILPAKLISPAQAEKLLGKGHAILDDLVNKGPGKPVLVPGSDPRPPLQVDAEDEFDDLDNA